MNRQIPVDLPEGYLDFYINLESWENEQEIILKQSCSFLEYDINRVFPEMIAKKESLLQLKGINIKPEEYKELFSQFLSLLNRLRSQTSAVVNILFDNIEILDFAVILQALIEDEKDYFSKLALAINVSDELLIFIFDHSLRPFLRIYASPYQEKINQDDFSLWALPMICPICGAQSSFSRLRAKDGKRFMFCDRCFTEWKAEYLQCGRCGNNQPETIKYITIEHDEAYQLYYCEKCNGYLKTYDERQTGRSTDLYIANIETVYLDMLAKAKGFSNHEFE